MKKGKLVKLVQNSKSITIKTVEEQYKNLEQVNPGLGAQGLKGIINTFNTQAAGEAISLVDIGWIDESYSVRLFHIHMGCAYAVCRSAL